MPLCRSVIIVPLEHGIREIDSDIKVFGLPGRHGSQDSHRISMADIDQLLTETEKASLRDLEIQRILDCNPNDYFHIVEISPGNDSLLKKNYHKKSLLIHPDKSDNPQASKAFDLLQKAYKLLNDQESAEVKKLKDIYGYVMAEASTDIPQKVNDILEQEFKQQRVQQQAQKQQEAQDIEHFETLKQQRELHKQFETNWDSHRDSRVANWRSFRNKVAKKKSKKTKFLA